MARRGDILGVAGAETIIGAGVVAKGTITSEADIVVDGNLVGDIIAKGDVTLGVNAVVNGNITGLNVTVGGALTGNIIAEGEITIGETARVTGNINCTGFAVNSGAIFNGRCHMAAPIRLNHDSDE